MTNMFIIFERVVYVCPACVYICVCRIRSYASPEKYFFKYSQRPLPDVLSAICKKEKEKKKVLAAR